MKLSIIAIFAAALIGAALLTYHVSRGRNVRAAGSQTSAVLTVVGDSDRDIGKVDLGDSATIMYTLRNSGTESIQISNVHPSCGCTAAVLDSNIVKPGQASHIKAIFNTVGKSEGPFLKTITVTTNSMSRPIYHLAFHGILKMPEKPHGESMMHLSGIFEGQCASCHATQGRGQLGEALWKADCVLCHTGADRNSPPAIVDSKMSQLSTDKFIRIVRAGIAGKNMPAFDESKGGPLTDQQIISLREFFEWKANHKL